MEFLQLGQSNSEIEEFYGQLDYKYDFSALKEILALKKNGRLVGACYLSLEDGALILRGLQVAPQEQRHGVGRALLKYVDSVVGSQEAWCIHTAALRGFYGSCGFEEVRSDLAPDLLIKRLQRFEKLVSSPMLFKRKDRFRLKKAGAGLPYFEAFMMRYFIFPKYSRSASWEQSQKLFEAEGRRLIEGVGALSPHALAYKKLSPRIAGIEDSSRYWSPAMILEHLMIVGRAMGDIIERLSRGESPKTVVKIAAVKPLGLSDPQQVREDFLLFAKTHSQKILSAVQDRNSQTTCKHPWFGAIRAAEWYWLMGAHQGIHRKQLVEIMKDLPSA
jgi:N-acetylglutamate synthase-like GNAT family acetyltransferase